jgi:hypothetical protein
LDNLISNVNLEMNGPGRLVVIGDDAAPARGGASGSSLELRRPTALKLGFQCGFLERHHGDVANSFCSPWDGSGRWWRLGMMVSLL